MKNQKMHKIQQVEKKNNIVIKIDDSKIPNKFHLEIQQNNKAIVYKNKKKYTRKQKHKGETDYE